MSDGLDKLQELAHKTWAKARQLEDRRQRGLRRLRSFNILTRLVLFWRFQKIRKILHRQEMIRSHLVMMALGMTRRVKLIRRKMKNAGRH